MTRTPQQHPPQPEQSSLFPDPDPPPTPPVVTPPPPEPEPGQWLTNVMVDFFSGGKR